jgi:prevent-host-death family protein
MKTFSLHEARADFSKLVERALAGEPQRVTRYGKEAVVIEREKDWRRRRSAATLGGLLASHAGAGSLGGDTTDRPWTERELGQT